MEKNKTEIKETIVNFCMMIVFTLITTAIAFIINIVVFLILNVIGGYGQEHIIQQAVKWLGLTSIVIAGIIVGWFLTMAGPVFR